MWLAGGGIKGGMAYGATDDFGWHAVENRVHVHDLHATILHLMGIDHEQLTYRYSGRDYRLTDVTGTWCGTSWPDRDDHLPAPADSQILRHFCILLHPTARRGSMRIRLQFADGNNAGSKVRAAKDARARVRRGRRPCVSFVQPTESGYAVASMRACNGIGWRSVAWHGSAELCSLTVAVVAWASATVDCEAVGGCGHVGSVPRECGRMWE